MGERHKVIFETEIKATNGHFEVSRTLELPFVPHAGMGFIGVRFPGDCFDVSDVCYDVARGIFIAHAKDDKIFHWDEAFCFEYAKGFIEDGCEVDGFNDPEKWRRSVLQKPDLPAPES